MGLFEFFKPRKEPLQALTKLPRMQKAMLATDLEFTQKQIANLRAVGRDSEAEKLIIDFRNKLADFSQLTFKEWDKSPLPRPTPDQMARVSYRIAYHVLPAQAYKEFTAFLDAWRTIAPPIGFMLCEYGCSMWKVRPTPEFATAFKTHEGRLHSGCDYYVLQFPPAPSPAQMPHGNLIEIMTKSPEKMPVLAPHFAAIVEDRSSGRNAYYVLGQSPSGGTTFRTVTADGANANLGPGPEPTMAAFVQHLAKRHVS